MLSNMRGMKSDLSRAVWVHVEVELTDPVFSVRSYLIKAGTVAGNQKLDEIR